MRTDVTVLIVTFKSEESIYRCINLIPKKYDVLVIENSADNIFKSDLEKKYNNVKCILAGENFGFGKASNIGLNLIKTKYTFLDLKFMDVKYNVQGLVSKKLLDKNIISEYSYVTHFNAMDRDYRVILMDELYNMYYG